jgi:methylamine dehydrogenase accessory protein MauD
MSGLLLASHVLLWVLVVVEAIALIALMRQVGTLLLRVGSSTAFDAGGGPAIGAEAPWVPAEVGEVDGGTDGRATMLVFVSVGCGMCDVLAPGLSTIASAYAASSRVYAIGKEGKDSLDAWARSKRVRVPVLSQPDAFDAYGVSGTPYAFVVDAGGVVQAGGGVNTTDQLEGLLRQCTNTERLSSEQPEIEAVAPGLDRRNLM